MTSMLMQANITIMTIKPLQHLHRPHIIIFDGNFFLTFLAEHERKLRDENMAAFRCYKLAR